MLATCAGSLVFTAVACTSRPNPPTQAVVEGAISASDDYATQRSAFVKATTALVEDGRCTVAELKEIGGWVKSQNNKSEPVYFTYCGGMVLSNRLYLNTSTGRVYK